MITPRSFWIGASISAALLALFVFVFVDFETIGGVLQTANYSYVVPSIGLYLLAVVFRTVRWRFLLRPLVPETKRGLFPVVVVGYAANNVIPVRIGEVVRSYYLSLREGVSAAAAFGTIAVERAADVVVLLLFLGLAWLFLPLSGSFERIAQYTPGGAPVVAVAALIPFLVVAGLMALVSLISHEKTLRFLDRLIGPLPKKIRLRLLGLAASLLHGLTVINTPGGLVRLFLFSLPVWACEAGMYYLIALGFDVRLPGTSQFDFIALIFLFTAAANLAGIVPSTAGGWGPFDAFGAAALTGAGVDANVALAFAVTVHVALWVPPTALGIGFLVADGTSMGRLVRTASTRPAGAVPAVGAHGQSERSP